MTPEQIQQEIEGLHAQRLAHLAAAYDIGVAIAVLQQLAAKAKES